LTALDEATVATNNLKGDCPQLAAALPRLLRHQPETLDAYFQPVCVSSQIDHTKARLCCHYLVRDGNGNVRVKDLAERLQHEVINYAIPRSRVQEAYDDYTQTQSTAKLVKLEREATKLFTDLKNTGEGGELLLYALTETVLGLPQLLCKMPLKTSARMHYHGVDGIHGTVDSASGMLALYWGESKLHKTVSSAVADCFKSIAPFIRADGGSGTPERRDIELLRDNINLDNPHLEAAFRRYLDPDDPLYLKLQYRGVCLVGFDLDDYADPFDPQDQTAVTDAAVNALKSWRDQVEQGIQKERLESILIETFCIPFPSVDAFREAFLREMGLLRGA
jgi:hypothetical protein